jgi:hypothetical protein
MMRSKNKPQADGGESLSSRTKRGPINDEWGLWLYFTEGENPQLEEARFRLKGSKQIRHTELKDKWNPKGYKWGKAVKAFCLFFVAYVKYCKQRPDPSKFKFSDPPRKFHKKVVGAAQSFYYTIKKKPDWLTFLFMTDTDLDVIEGIFDSANAEHGKDFKPIILFLKDASILPASFVRIYLNDNRLEESSQLIKLYRGIENQESDFKLARHKTNPRLLNRQKSRGQKSKTASNKALGRDKDLIYGLHVTTAHLREAMRVFVLTKEGRIEKPLSNSESTEPEAASPFRLLVNEAGVAKLKPTSFVGQFAIPQDLYNDVIEKLNLEGLVIVKGTKASKAAYQAVLNAVVSNFPPNKCLYLDLARDNSDEALFKVLEKMTVGMPQESLVVLDNAFANRDFLNRALGRWAMNRSYKLLLLGR